MSDYGGMFREPGGALKHPFLTPGSDQYADVLWDWDSWLSNVALRQILAKVARSAELDRARPYERPPGSGVGPGHGRFPSPCLYPIHHHPRSGRRQRRQANQRGGDADFLSGGNGTTQLQVSSPR